MAKPKRPQDTNQLAKLIVDIAVSNDSTKKKRSVKKSVQKKKSK